MYGQLLTVKVSVISYSLFVPTEPWEKGRSLQRLYFHIIRRCMNSVVKKLHVVNVIYEARPKEKFNLVYRIEDSVEGTASIYTETEVYEIN